MARDLDIRSQASRALEAQLIKFTDRHQSVRALRAELAAADSQLAESIRMARARSLPGMPVGVGGVSMISTEAELASARQQLDALSKQTEQTRQRLFEAQDRQVSVEQKQREIAQAQKLIDEINQRISRLNIEMGTDDTQSRIVILPRVDSPAGPTTDNRAKFAALGLMFGAAVPLGFVMLLGLLDRRVRYCEDAQDAKSRLTLLGILPYLPADLQDPEQAAVAAHCVHQIRTLLQIGGADHSRKVFAITSPTSGDGKTSLAMALGLSFAQSGARTLMLDFDLIGAGLTSAMGARSPSGVLDATLHGEINGFVRPTSFPGLDIIPAGSDDARDVSKLSLQLVRNLIRQAHDRYDAVVIDTGPVLGSLEASLVCAAADGSIPYNLRHRYRLLSLIPRSRAISAMRLLLVSISRTASRLNSSVYFFRSTAIGLCSSIQCTCLLGFPPLNRGKLIDFSRFLGGANCSPRKPQNGHYHRSGDLRRLNIVYLFDEQFLERLSSYATRTPSFTLKPA
ncbi:AAA family ATPase [Leptolyngbya sp. 15MV]|nr:AAA family ATPase [Leptolyngbya sp. 15MV]